MTTWTLQWFGVWNELHSCYEILEFHHCIILNGAKLFVLFDFGSTNNVSLLITIQHEQFR